MINAMTLIFRLLNCHTWIEVFLVEHPTVLIRFDRVHFMLLTSTLEINYQLLNFGIRIVGTIIFGKPFLNFIVSKFKIGLRSLLQQGLSDPEFYGDLVYKFRKIYALNDFKIREFILRYMKYRYNINIIWQAACMVVNPITASNFAFLFGCAPVGRASGFGIIVLLHVHGQVTHQNPHVQPSES